MSIQSWIAGRYFRSGQRQKFLPLMTAVSIGGVALGTIALIVVLSVMRGFSNELEKRFMGFNSHLTITKTAAGASDLGDIKSLLPQGSEITPFVEGEAIARTTSRGEVIASGVKVRGITPAEGLLKSLELYFPEGSGKLAELESSSSKVLPGVILGSEILAQLTVHPDFEDRIDLVAPLADIGPTGEMEPKVRTYRLIGAFRSGVFEYDSKFAFVSIDEARRLLGAQAVFGWHIMLPNPKVAPQVSAALHKKLGDAFKIQSWDVQNKKLFAALKLERIAMTGILILIILIASFSIAGVLMMVISTRRKDIAILTAMGMNAGSIKKVFLVHAMYIGALGSVIGTILGSLLCIALMRWPIRLPASYYLDMLPVAWSPAWTAVFMACGVFVAMVASLYPTSEVTKEDPIVILRYE